MTGRLPIALTLLILIAAPPVAAGERWTFCVASMLGAKDVWITEVFPAGSDRERLEVEFKDVLERQGSARIVAQCPLPSDDKTSVVNAQIAAEEFNRKLGGVLHAVAAQEFPPRR
ncbi:MAG: hypothetical protein ACLQE9_09860 [Roseiarcus sp.]